MSSGEEGIAEAATRMVSMFGRQTFSFCCGADADLLGMPFFIKLLLYANKQRTVLKLKLSLSKSYAGNHSLPPSYFATQFSMALPASCGKSPTCVQAHYPSPCVRMDCLFI